MSNQSIDLCHLVDLGKENSWSDLLATFIEVDPLPMIEVLGAPRPQGALGVRREVSAGSAGRIDLLLTDDGVPWAAIEAKVLSSLGPNQLARYRQAWPEVAHRRLLGLQRLGMPARPDELDSWESLDWEDVVTRYSRSSNSWVRETAIAWLAGIDRQIPMVDLLTIWNDIESAAGLVGGLRARMAWTLEQLKPAPPAIRDLTIGSGGKSPVVRMLMDISAPGYVVLIEAQEGLSAQSFASYGDPAKDVHLRGPIVRICLLQEGVEDSRSYNWDLLFEMWRRVESAGHGRWTWDKRKASPKASHDKAAVESLRLQGLPDFVGIGYGDRQGQLTGQVLFGAKMRVCADVSLGDFAAGLNELAGYLPGLQTLGAV